MRLSRDWATWIAVLNAALGLIVALGWMGLTQMQAGALVTVATAVAGLVTAALVKPFAPTAATYLASVAFEALAAFHYDVAPAVIGGVNLLILALVAAVIRPQSTPNSDPVLGSGVSKADVPAARPAIVP
jgi:hypothetical protein